MAPRIVAAVAALAVAAVVAAACGGGGERSVPTASAAPTTTTPQPRAQQDDQRPPSVGQGWRTNWSKRTINLRELIPGGPPRDGIPPIYSPQLEDAAAGNEWLQDRIPVVVLDMNGDARAYPLSMLTLHEVVNDVVGGVPVAVTFCPLCNTAVVFDRRVDGQVHSFGVSGLLRLSDLVMWDRETESLWQQASGEAIVGELAGKRLEFVPSSLINWGQFKEAFPKGKVLSRESFPLYKDIYGFNPYENYDRGQGKPFLFSGELDTRLPAMERIVGMRIGQEAVAYPFSALKERRVVQDRVGGQEFVIFWGLSDTASALSEADIEKARAVGTATVFEPVVDGRRLTFVAESDSRFRDNETGSVWDMAGQALSGPLAGKSLRPLVYGTHFWFSWASFNPDTGIFQPS